MKKVDITVEVSKDGNGIYYGRLHRDDNGKLYARIPGPNGQTLTLVENLQRDGYSIEMVREKGGKKNDTASGKGKRLHKRNGRV